MRFFRAASARLLPSYDEPGHEPTARTRPSASLEQLVGGVREVPVAHRRPGRRALLGDGRAARGRSGRRRRRPRGRAPSRRRRRRSPSPAPRRSGAARRCPAAASRRPAGRRRRRRTCGARGRACEPRHGYFVQASSVARVRLSPTERPSASADFASSRVRMRSVWALPSKPPHSAAELVERDLAVVAERRVAHVVRERGGLGEVGVAAERVGEVAGDLGDLEAVGQPVAHEVVGLRPEHLGLGRQPAQRRGVHHPGPVALERGAFRAPRPAWPARRRGARGRRRRTARPRSRRRTR